MFRDPWFRIIDVTEPRGLSIADIAREEAEKAGVSLDQLRGRTRKHDVVDVRRRVYDRARVERPDLSSSQIANYMRKDASSVRHAWRRMEADQ